MMKNIQIFKDYNSRLFEAGVYLEKLMNAFYFSFFGRKLDITTIPGKISSLNANVPVMRLEKLLRNKLQNGLFVKKGNNETIHHFWLSKYEYLPARKLFKVLKKRVDGKLANPFLNLLLEDAELYRLMHETNFKPWKNEESEIKGSLDALMLFRVTPQSLIGDKGHDEKIIGQLGNLILVPESINNQLQNQPFKIKKEILLKHKVELPTAILEAKSWGEEQITARTMALAELAYKEIWNL